MASYPKRSGNIGCSLRIGRRLLELLELSHRDVIAEMPLEQLVGHESFGSVALCIDKGDMVIDFADSLQLIGVAMVVGASVDTNEEDGDVDP